MFDPDILGKEVMAKKVVKTFGYCGWQEKEVEVKGKIVGFSETGPTYKRVRLFSSVRKTSGFSFAVEETEGNAKGNVFETASIRFIGN